MSDVILQTHPLEFQNSRQATKITYLQHEITHLQDNARDLEELVRINKEAMKIMSNQYSQSNNKTKSSSQEDITSSTIDQHSSPQSNKNFYALSEQLQEENARLLEMVQKLKKDRAVAQSKALLSEQIMEEVQRHESEVVSEMEQKILDLRKMIQDKEFFIQQLEKVKPFPDQDGVIVKFREVMSATDQNMRLHEEINNYKFMLNKMAIEVNKVKSENQELTNTNSRLNSELLKLKTMLANPVHNKFSLKSLFTGKQRQSRMNQSFNKSSQSPLQIPDDDLNSSKGSVNKLPSGGHASKPSKFKEAKKKPVSPQRYNSNPLMDMKLLEQISQLETELDSMKRRVSCEQINNGILSDELLKIKRICNDMMATNEILCKANKNHQEKWEQMSYAMEFYKAFYHKYMDLIAKRKPQTRGAIMEIPNIEALKKINETLVTGLEFTPVKLFTEREREDSNLSNKPECSKTPRRTTKIIQAPHQFTKQQAQAFLKHLSKEFYANIHPALAVLENSPTIPEEHEEKEVKCRTKVRRSKRSMSNALDYVCARRKLIFEPVQEEEPEEIRRAQRKGSLVHWNNAQGRGDEIGILALKVNRLASIQNSEHLSFSIDLEELDKVKANEASFISTNDFIQTLE